MSVSGAKKALTATLSDSAFVLSGLALTLSLSLTGSTARIAAGLALALPVYWYLARRFCLIEQAARTGGATRAAALVLAAGCAAYFSRSFIGELALRWPDMGIALWVLGGCVGALSV
jgi:hypothetical protein